MKLLGISGSLQRESSNTALLHTVRTIATDVDVVLFEQLAAIPAMNPDVDDAHVAPAVRELRELVASADAVMLASPEYAHGVPGALKNALDWLVGTGELYGKPLAVLSAAPARSAVCTPAAISNAPCTRKARASAARRPSSLVAPTRVRRSSRCCASCAPVSRRRALRTDPNLRENSRS
jgi:hypothetical protein